MNEVKTVWRWWVGWNIDNLEIWMEEMEMDGWNLIKADFTSYSPMRLKFKKGKNRKIRYCLDFQSNMDDNYFEIFKDDGWKLVDNKRGPMFIWSKSYEDERPHIYTDTKSLIERNNRTIINVLFGVFLSVFILYLVLIGNFDSTRLISLILIMSFVVYGYLIVQLYRYNKKLRQNAIQC